MGTVPLGFDPEHLVFTYVLLPERYSGNAEELGFYEDLRTRLNAIPGVEGSAFTSYLPLRLAGAGQMEIDGRNPIGQQDVAQNIVSPDYFQVLRVALRRGRAFEQQDRLGSPAVAVVNEAFANEYLAGADPIGQRVRIVGATGPGWLTVVGVVATETQADPAHEMTWHDQAILYRPLWQEPLNFQFIALRTRGDQAATGRGVERIMQSIDSEIPIAETFTPRGLLAQLLAYPRFRAMVIGAFAGLALLLAALGLYGLLSQYVTQRTRELGLRMAIGARTGDIVRLVALQGGIPVLVGLALGIALSTALAGYLTSLLFGVTPGELWTMIGAPVLLLVAAVAMAKPALDAAAVDPIVVLRDE
jgi:putative ABC transport system permease protein